MIPWSDFAVECWDGGIDKSAPAPGTAINQIAFQTFQRCSQFFRKLFFPCFPTLEKQAHVASGNDIFIIEFFFIPVFDQMITLLFVDLIVLSKILVDGLDAFFLFVFHKIYFSLPGSAMRVT